jgi:hypothetical protein
MTPTHLNHPGAKCEQVIPMRVHSELVIAQLLSELRNMLEMVSADLYVVNQGAVSFFVHHFLGGIRVRPLRPMAMMTSGFGPSGSM